MFSTKKPAMTKSFTKAPDKKRLRVSGNDEYDSDSDLSLPDDPLPSSRRRPTRTGAVQAKKNIAECMKAAGGGDDDDESSYGSDDGDDGSDDESVGASSEMEISDSEESVEKEPAKKPPKKKAKAAASTATQRAREKQRQALEAAKSKKGVKGKQSKKAPQVKKNGNGKKNKMDYVSSGTSDSSDDEKGDPMDEIDLDELMKEAMRGARFSILHSFCWWRIVLDEAHYIKSRSSQTAAAAFSLIGINRWCLSGTPLQNRVGERKCCRQGNISPDVELSQSSCSCYSL